MKLIFLLLCISCVKSHLTSQRRDKLLVQPQPLDDLQCQLSTEVVDEIQSYQDTVRLIFDAFTDGILKGRAYQFLGELTDSHGYRLTGSDGLENAIDWVLANAGDFDEAYTEDAQIPVWERNQESLFMVEPSNKELHIIGLGTSIGTPSGGIQAEALVVTSFEDLENKKDQVDGKIVVYDFDYESYSRDAIYRYLGASEASKYGATGAVMRSLTSFSIQSPHTGAQYYSGEGDPIPAACLSVEDASLLRRISERGETIVLNLTMGAENFEDAMSRNTVLELTGREIPEEFVMVSGHLDAWDAASGVIDDASGCTLAWMAGIAMKELDIRPRRTLQAVMFTGEEQGIFGGYAFYNQHLSEVSKYQIMMEADLGIFDPSGIQFSSNDTDSYCIMQEIMSLLAGTNMTQLVDGAETPDLGAFLEVGVPLASPITSEEKYFWYHHSAGDTLEVVDSDELDRLGALWTSVSYVLADISFRLN